MSKFKSICVCRPRLSNSLRSKLFGSQKISVVKCGEYFHKCFIFMSIIFIKGNAEIVSIICIVHVVYSVAISDPGQVSMQVLKL